MQKEDSIDSLLSYVMVDLTKLLYNPRVCKKHITGLAQKPLAPPPLQKDIHSHHEIQWLFLVAGTCSIFRQAIFPCFSCMDKFTQ